MIESLRKRLLPQTKAEKPIFAFAKGLVSEAPSLGFPDGATTDEVNFDLLIDGTRRKRRGLANSSDLYTGTEVEASSTAAAQNHVRVINAGNISGAFNPIVLKYGSYLYWWNDNLPWSSETVYLIDLTPYRAPGGTDTEVKNGLVTFAVGNGKLFVSGQYLETVKIEWTSIGVTTIEIITPRMRWYEDVDDDINISERPYPTLTDSHRANLLIRGWSDSDITDYYTNSGSTPLHYPAKNDIWYYLYARSRTVAAGVGEFRDSDWTKQRQATKLFAEAFGNQSAARGAIIANVYDTTDIELRTNSGSSITSIAWYIPAETPSGTWAHTTYAFPVPAGRIGIVIECDTPHGLTSPALDDVTMHDTSGKYTDSSSVKQYLDGRGALTGVSIQTSGSVTRFYYDIAAPGDWDGTTRPVTNLLGSYSVDGFEMPSPPGYTTDARPTANAFYAGRLWLGGIGYGPLADKVYFSQIGVSETGWDRMYQEGDPTGENYQGLVSDDGGSIQITGLSNVRDMRQMGDSLIVFAETGVWEIRGGEGYFAANDYLIRKLSDVDCLSEVSITEAEGLLFFASTRGCYMIAPNETTGHLGVQSLTDAVIETIWKDKSKFQLGRPSMVYDDIRKKVWLNFPSSSAGFSNAVRSSLIYDLRLQAWHFYEYSATMLLLTTIPTQDASATEYDKLQFLQVSAGGSPRTLGLLDFSDAEAYIDDTSYSYDAFLALGYDNTGDWGRYKQAPTIHTYMQKTETGYTAGTSELLPVNESSMTLQVRWDFADHANSNKYTTAVQIYKHRRLYTPVDVNDDFDDGQPILVVRNKIRGRGRSLHLYFDASQTDKPAHLLGWLIQYAGTRRL